MHPATLQETYCRPVLLQLPPWLTVPLMPLRLTLQHWKLSDMHLRQKVRRQHMLINMLLESRTRLCSRQVGAHGCSTCLLFTCGQHLRRPLLGGTLS
jgi:hypothetical protein